MLSVDSSLSLFVTEEATGQRHIQRSGALAPRVVNLERIVLGRAGSGKLHDRIAALEECQREREALTPKSKAKQNRPRGSLAERIQRVEEAIGEGFDGSISERVGCLENALFGAQSDGTLMERVAALEQSCF